ncbi:hypothetical protein EM6_0274 [Asticcacaulis excentricus]|uniref:Uncharacterized protein n=1 Tax=Asticcacaulis excentricus TaxID=78587 RepID=A0A3G9G417_9CAUL|nr:hypothetical protein EM6_0274 [Asticcacaulis excentricus]
MGPAVLERYTRIQQHALQIAKSDEERTEALKPFEWQALTVE